MTLPFGSVSQINKEVRLPRSKNRFWNFGRPKSGAIQSSDSYTPSCLAMARQPSAWLLRAAIFVESSILGRSAKLLPLCSRISEAYPDAFRNQTALQIRLRHPGPLKPCGPPACLCRAARVGETSDADEGLDSEDLASSL
jgi:hypothetical protein